MGEKKEDNLKLGPKIGNVEVEMGVSNVWIKRLRESPKYTLKFNLQIIRRPNYNNYKKN